MALTLSQIINASVSVAGAPPANVSFGIPLLFGYESGLPASPVYVNAEDLLSELTTTYSVATSDPAYVAASDILAQSSLGPQVQQVGVVKRSASVAQIDTVVTPGTPDITETYTVTINGTAFSSVNPADQATLISDLVSAINAGAEPVTAAPASPNITLTADVAGTPFTAVVSTNTPAMTISTTTPNVNGATQLATIWAATKAFYAVVPVGASGLDLPTLDIAQMAAAIETMEAIGVFQSNVAGCYDPASITDPAYLLNNSSYTRSMLVYHDLTTESVAGAIAGRWLAYDPDDGLTPAANKTLSSVTAWDGLGTNFTALKTKRGNGHIKIMNRDVSYGGRFRDGLMSSSFSAKQRVGIDWAIDQLRVQMFGVMDDASNEGRDIIFTDSGIQAVVNAVEAVGADMYRIGLVSSEPTVTYPNATDVSAADKAAGLLSGLRMSGEIADSVIYAAVNAFLTR